MPVITVLELTTIVCELNQSLMLKSNLTIFRYHVSTPKVACSDPAAWCAAVNQIMKGNPLQSSPLKGNYNFNNEQRVDFYLVEASTGRSSHLVESFPFCSDSGAECTIIKESVASKFSGKRTTDIVVIREVGNTFNKRTPPILSIVFLMIYIEDNFSCPCR